MSWCDPTKACILCGRLEDDTHTLKACREARRGWRQRLARRLADALAFVSRAVGQ